MKCPMCGGDGITDKFTPNVGRCIKCNGSGEIEATNEEWLHFATTEQMADVIAKIMCRNYSVNMPNMEEAKEYAMPYVTKIIGFIEQKKDGLDMIKRRNTMPIKSAGTYMQLSNLCKRCSRQSFCGNGMTDYYCTGYEPTASDIKVPPFTDGLKEIIEATEKLAEKCDKINANVNKYGRKNICDVDDDLDDMENGRCVWDTDVYLDALDKKELTNEEWFCSLSTEEKAKRIINIAVNSDCDYRTIVKWLKEKHDGNMGRNP